MNGAALLQCLKDRLSMEGLSGVDGMGDDALYRHLTAGRNRVLRRLAMAGGRSSVAVRTVVTLEQDGSDSRIYALPEATAEPIRWLEVRPDGGGIPLTAAGNVAQRDVYELYSTRSIRLAYGYTAVDGLEAVIVESPATAVTSSSTEGQIGVPVPAHSWVAYEAAVLALTADEQSDASVAAQLAAAEQAEVLELYNGFNDSEAKGLGEAFGVQFQREAWG